MSAMQLLKEAREDERTAIAVLLILDELARSDGDFDRREASTIASCLAAYGLEEARLRELMEAVEATRTGHADLVGLSRVLKTRLPAQSMRNDVARALWQLVLADGTLTPMEDRLVNSITMLIGVTYKQVAEIKAEFGQRS